MHSFNPLNTQLNPICQLLALLGAQHILHVSGVRVKQGSFIFSLWFVSPTTLREDWKFKGNMGVLFGLCVHPAGLIDQAFKLYSESKS